MGNWKSGQQRSNYSITNPNGNAKATSRGAAGGNLYCAKILGKVIEKAEAVPVDWTGWQHF